MATFRKKRSKQYKSRTKSRRNYTNKRRGKKTLRGGGIFQGFSRFPRFPRFIGSNSQVAPAPDPSPTSSSPFENVLLALDKNIEDIDKFISEITDKKNELEKINTTEDTESLPMYITAIITTSRILTDRYYRLMLKIYNLERSNDLFKQKQSLLENHIAMLDLVSNDNTQSVNKLKSSANTIAITYYDELLTIITRVKANLVEKKLSYNLLEEKN